MTTSLSLPTFTIIISSVLLSSLAQITLKFGMLSQSVLLALQKGGRLEIAISMMLNTYIIAGLLLYLIGAVLWLFVLAKMDVSIAYPFVGLGFIFTMLLARLAIGEPLSTTKILGTILVSFGVLLIAQKAP